jgi:hypothetical protein
MGRRVSALLDIKAETWLPDYTRELIDLLHVLGLLVELQPAQAEVLNRVLAGPLVDVTELAPRPTGGARIAPEDVDTLPQFELRHQGSTPS